MSESLSTGVDGRRLHRVLAWTTTATAIAGASLIGVGLFAKSNKIGPLGNAQALGISGIGCILLAFVLGTFASQRADTSRVREGRERLRHAEDSLVEALRSHGEAGQSKEDSDLTLPALWAVTHSRLELYHDIALGQARRSFRDAQWASALGFALLAVFVGFALRSGTTAGSVVAGSMGAVAAALAGYVSRTFVKSAETAAAHLHAYFEQPLEFSRYLAAERIVRDCGLDESKRAEALAALVSVIAAGPHALARDSGEPTVGAI
ncbi:hypothetical protein ACFY1B_45995 [Streptomyces mirabilis]|uniref:TRADD-N-associated membrane domain-containing protein n=1 Tax=Streptomyces mirabilis TaxID=68239 RepID=UPI003659F352